MSFLGLLFPLAGLACLLTAFALILNAGWNLVSGRAGLVTAPLIAVFLGSATILGGMVVYLVTAFGKSDDFAGELAGPQAWQGWLFLVALLVPHLFWLAVFRSPLRAALISGGSILCAIPEFRAILAAA